MTLKGTAVWSVISNPIFWVIIALYMLKDVIASAGWNMGRSDVSEPKDEVGSSFDDSTARWYASELEKAMETLDGQDEERIFQLLGGLSIADFNKVYNAFGEQYYSHTFGEGGMPAFSNKLDLIGWLKSELELEELEQLRSINPSLPI